MSDFLKKQLFEKAAQLQADAQPQWGSMSPQHIIEHFIMALAISSGVLDLPVMTSEDRSQKAYEAIITNNQPLKQNLRVPFVSETPPPYEYANLAEAIAALQKSIDNFYAFFAQKPDAKPNHPVFGGLSFQEWEAFHEKHFRHHLAQFGL